MSDYERGNRSVGSIAAQIDRVLNRMLPADADKEAELWPLIYEYGHAAEVRASSQHVTESTETATEGREAVARWMIEHGYATGHGDTLDDLLTELASQERPHDNHDGCNPYDPAHIAGKAPASQERPQPTIEQLAAEQGIKRITNVDDLRIDGLTDEEADSFMDALAFLERPQPVHDIGPGYCRTCEPGFGHNHPDWQERPSIDVERLARAFDAHPGPVRASDNIAHDRGHHGEECWQQIAAEYARLSGPVGE